jgi:hypothetical protein
MQRRMTRLEYSRWRAFDELAWLDKVEAIDKGAVPSVSVESLNGT